MKAKKFFVIFLFILLFSVLAGLTAFFLQKKGLLLPNWIRWNQQTLTWENADETYNVKVFQKTVKVFDSTGEVWSLNPQKYKVQDALIMDVNRDGLYELVVLCWRIGRYDNVPFWKEDPLVWTQHIYIYKADDFGIQPLWMASDIGPYVDSWYNDDKFLYLHSPDGSDNRWIWLDWGFVLAN